MSDSAGMNESVAFVAEMERVWNVVRMAQGLEPSEFQPSTRRLMLLEWAAELGHEGLKKNRSVFQVSEAELEALIQETRREHAEAMLERHGSVG